MDYRIRVGRIGNPFYGETSATFGFTLPAAAGFSQSRLDSARRFWRTWADCSEESGRPGRLADWRHRKYDTLNALRHHRTERRAWGRGALGDWTKYGGKCCMVARMSMACSVLVLAGVWLVSPPRWPSADAGGHRILPGGPGGHVSA